MTTWLLAVATMAFVMSATPGPNTVLFAASGARVGYWRTMPGVVGMLVGFAALIAISSIGLGAVLAQNTPLRSGLTLCASAYMIWLAMRLWRNSAGATADDSDKPLLAWWQFVTLQFVNPKTWLASVAFVSGLLGANAPGDAATSVLGVVWFLAVVSVSASIWTLFGASLRTRVSGERWSTVNRSMAVLALLTVPTFWV